MNYILVAITCLGAGILIGIKIANNRWKNNALEYDTRLSIDGELYKVLDRQAYDNLLNIADFYQ